MVKLSRPGFSLTALGKSTQGAAMLEFAFLAPLLLSLLLGANELTRWMRARQHMEDYAATVAADVSAVAATISAGTLRELVERIGLVAPELVDSSRAAWNPTATQSDYLGVGITMVMVSQTDPLCHTKCSFKGDVVWTFGSLQRACGVFPLPKGSEINGPLVVVDVRSTYKFVFDLSGRFGSAPTLSTSVFENVRNWKAAGLAPKVVPQVSGDWKVNVCPTTV